MKRIIIFALAAVIVLASGFSAYGVTLDGRNDGTEWDGATVYMLFDGESNSSVDWGAVKAKFAPEENAVYLCFMFGDSGLEQGNTLAGISFSVEGSPSYNLTMDNSPYAADIDKYDVSGAMFIDNNNGATCEMRVGIKSGVPKELSCSVRYIDHEGVPSNYYYFTLVNEQYTETTKLIIAPTADNPDPAYNPEADTTQKVKTTKATTERTTKEKTTKSTTARKTTTKKPKTTKQAKTTKLQKTEKETQAATVYYYEKEIIISQVIVTQTVPSTTVAIVQTTEVESITEPPTTSIHLSAGSKYKTIAGVACAAVFIAVAAWSVMGAKKEKKEEAQNSEENK